MCFVAAGAATSTATIRHAQHAAHPSRQSRARAPNVRGRLPDAGGLRAGHNETRDPMNDAIVIVGGGHAGAQLCAGLAAAGLGARVHLVCAEAELPYQRPPLSKSFLKSAQEVIQPHRAPAWYVEAGITLHRADPAVAIDRARRVLRLRSGRELGYAQLVLATGGRARGLAHVPDGLMNVATLRSAADALRLRA